MIKSPNQVVFILGSGFSKAVAGIPIQKDFFNQIIESNDQGKLFEDQLKKLGFNPNADIETALTALYARDQYDKYLREEKHESNRTRPAKAAIINFRMAMNEFLRKPDNFEACTAECGKKNFKRIFEKAKDNDAKVSFITTNFDLELEKILKDIDASSSQKIDLAKAYFPECFPPNHKHQICKLHGSINWFEEREWDDQKKELKGKKSPPCLIVEIKNDGIVKSKIK
jgi:hypothetical protein